MIFKKPRAEKAARRQKNWSQTFNTTLDVAGVFITPLKDAAKISNVPFLSIAATSVLSIVDLVQKMRFNKDQSKELENYSCKIVCYIINESKDVSHPGEVPVDLEKNLEQLVNVLRSIEEFAREGASRNSFSALVHSRTDAQRIQEYKEKLSQAIQFFGLQTDIKLRKSVAEQAKNQAVMMEKLDAISHVLSPSNIPSYHSLTNILRKTNGTSDVTFEALFHFEKLLRTMGPIAIYKQIKNRGEDKKNLIEFVKRVLDTEVFKLSPWKDGKEKTLHLLHMLQPQNKAPGSNDTNQTPFQVIFQALNVWSKE